MSRSKKKNPYGTLCNCRAGEMKDWKNKANRKIRKTVEEMPKGAGYKKLNEIWESPGDGKADLRRLFSKRPWKWLGK